MQSQLTRAESSATAALRNIYTESQKVSRALQAAASQRLQFKGYDTKSFDSLTKAIERFKSLQVAAVAVNEPLSAAARTIERLSASVQGSFDPALKSAQKSAEYLSAALNRGGIVGEKSFDRIQKRAIAAAEAADRLAEASQLASSGPRGTELAFVDPRARDALARSAAARQAAANAPALVLEFGNIGEQVKRLVEVDSLIENVRAELESAIILKVDTVPTQAKLNDLISQSERLSRTLSEAVDGTAAKATAADAARRAQAASRFLQVNQSESTLLSNQDAASTVDPTGRTIQQRLQDISALRAREELKSLRDAMIAIGKTDAPSKPIDALEQNLREAQVEVAKLDGAMRAAGERNVANIKSFVSRNAGSEDAARLAARRAGELRDEARTANADSRRSPSDFAPPLPPGFGGRSDAGLGGSLDDPLRKIDQLRQKIVATRSAIESLPEPLQAQFIPALQQSENQLRALAAAGDASGENFKSAASSADSLSTSVGKVGAQANAVRALSDRFSDFNDALKTRAIASFTAELTVMENTVVGISQKMRGPALAAMRAYSVAVDDALNSGNIEDPAIQRTLAKLRAEFIAAAKQAGVSGPQLAASLKRAGDVGRGGFDRFSLALNQAAFAIDDFFSATGGLEFKLRAVSNNITQLAFILGGTTGLFVGLAAVIGGQLAVALTKWANGGKTSEDRTKSLNDALARQKGLVEELAQAFRTLGDSLTRDAFSPAAREANEFRKELNEIIKKQKELREARVADADPTVQLERANQNAINRRLESEENPGRRVALQRQLEESRVREREAARAANAGNATRDDVRRSLERAQANVGVAQLPAASDAGSAARREIEAARIRRQAAADAERAAAGTEAQQRAAIEAEIRRLTPIAANGDAVGFGSSAAASNAIAELNQVLAKLDANGIARANNALVVSILEGAKNVSDALAQAQRSIANADFGPSRIATQADAVARQLQSLAEQLETATDEKAIQALKAQQEALLKVSLTLRSAASSVEQFAATIDRIAGQLSDTVLQEAEGRANQARREVNAARGAVDAGVENVPEFNRPRAAADQRGRLDEAKADRRRAEADVQRAREGQQELERRRRTAVRQFEVRAEAGLLGQEAEGLVGQRNQAQAVLDNEKATVAEQQQATETLASASARLDQLFQESALGTALAEFADGLDAAAQAAGEFDRQMRDRRASADRGRALTLTPGERAAEELNQQIADIREYADREVKRLGILRGGAVQEVRDRRDEAIARAEQDMMRQVAPTIAGMADSVRNAVLTGPSRAALNASDVTTTQGQQELNRLLRGDDPARDADMVTLQRETNELLRLIERKDNPVAQ